MSRPPIKAMKAVQRYCAKQKSCENCLLHTLTEYGYSRCFYSPADWEIKEEGETSDKTTDNR
jgi:hypothetical protein